MRGAAGRPGAGRRKSRRARLPDPVPWNLSADRAGFGGATPSALADVAWRERRKQLLLVVIEVFLEEDALRQHDAPALVIEVDDLQA